MVLLSFLLVLAAAVTLVIGLVGTGLGLIYLSIACSLAAGVVLAVAVVRSRPSTELAPAGPAPLASNEAHAYSRSPAAPRTPVGATSVLDRDEAASDTLDVGERIRVFAEPEPRVESEPAVLEAYDEDESAAEVDVEPAGEDVFAPADVEPEPAPAAATTSWDVRDDDWRRDDDVFPIADYDSLRVSQIVPLLSELDPDELETVREREVDVKGGRVSVLNRIDALLGRSTAPAARKAPAKKAAAKKAAAPAPKKAAVKKAPAAAKKAPAPAKKAPAAKAPAPPKKAATGSTSATKKGAAPAKKAAKATKPTKATKKQP